VTVVVRPWSGIQIAPPATTSSSIILVPATTIAHQ
jgi:hypothetical protein